jgi:hypothetical protein
VSKRGSGYNASINNRRSGYDTSIGNRGRGHDASIGNRRCGHDVSIDDRRRRHSMSTSNRGTCSPFVFPEVRVDERFLVCFQELGGPCVREGEGYEYWAPALSEPNGEIVED